MVEAVQPLDFLNTTALSTTAYFHTDKTPVDQWAFDGQETTMTLAALSKEGRMEDSTAVTSGRIFFVVSGVVISLFIVAGM